MAVETGPSGFKTTFESEKGSGKYGVSSNITKEVIYIGDATYEERILLRKFLTALGFFTSETSSVYQEDTKGYTEVFWQIDAWVASADEKKPTITLHNFFKKYNPLRNDSNAEMLGQMLNKYL